MARERAGRADPARPRHLVDPPAHLRRASLCRVGRLRHRDRGDRADPRLKWGVLGPAGGPHPTCGESSDLGKLEIGCPHGCAAEAVVVATAPLISRISTNQPRLRAETATSLAST